MHKILFAVDENNCVKVLKIDMSADDNHDVTLEDIAELEIGLFSDYEDYSLGVYKSNLVWIDMTSNNSESEPDGYWEISDDIELVTKLEDDL